VGISAAVTSRIRLHSFRNTPGKTDRGRRDEGSLSVSAVAGRRESKKPWENKVVEEMSRLIRTRTHGTVCGQM